MKVCENAACEGCPLRRINPDAQFVHPKKVPGLRAAIGEFPGEAASDTGVPFAGGSDGWLKVIYRNAGVDKANVSLLHVIQCRPPQDLFPTDPAARKYISLDEGLRAVQHCHNAHVKPFLESRPWQRVDLFGEEAVRWVARKEGGVSRWRGSALPLPGSDQLLTVPTLGISKLGADQTMIPVLVNDLRMPLVREPEHYNIYPSLEDLKAFRFKRFAFDIETSYTNHDEIYMVGLCAEPYKAIVVPFTDAYKEELVRIFAEAEEVIGQNLIHFDLPILARQGIKIRGPKECKVWDVMLMHHLRFPTFPHDLEFIGKQFTNKGAWKYDKVSKETYCARDTDVTLRILEPLKALLEQAQLLDMYQYVSWPLALICHRMSEVGIKRSAVRIKELRVEYNEALGKGQDALPEHMRTFMERKRRKVPAPPGSVNEKGKPIRFLYEEYFVEKHPWRSSKVKQHFLYEELKMPVQYKFGTTRITADKMALDRLYNRAVSPSQEWIKRYGEDFLRGLVPILRTLRTLNETATRLAAFKDAPEEEDSFVHTSFSVHGTESGRLSSSNPNMQNVNEEARFMFVPRNPGGRMIACDYSGIENRLVAFLARDHTRMSWFKDKEFSEHKYLAAILEEIPYEQVTKSKEKDSWYAISKAIVHGADRMRGAKNIWEKADLDPERVTKVLATWKAQISDTVRWQRRIAQEVIKTGWAVNPFGRKMWFWESGAATRIVSFFPQSTAFDVIARVMIGLMHERIGWPKEWAEKVCPLAMPLPETAELNLQVHDELVVETVSEEAVPETLSVLTAVMTQPWKELDGMTLPIGIGVGPSWGECA